MDIEVIELSQPCLEHLIRSSPTYKRTHHAGYPVPGVPKPPWVVLGPDIAPLLIHLDLARGIELVADLHV